MKTPSLLPPILAAFVLCSCGYEQRWEESVADYRAGRVKTPAGPWKGSWTTTTNDHTGDLRAIVTPAEDEPGKYDFHYHATWAKYFSGGYKVRYDVDERGNRYFVDGEENLGLFGKFRHRAIIDRDNFEATYSNDKGDLGKFSLDRPE